MTDPVRVVLFGLSLAALLFSSLVVVGRLRLGAVSSVLALWVVCTGQIVLLAETLSLLHGLDWPGFLIGHLSIAASAVVWLRLRPGPPPLYAVRTIWVGLRFAFQVARSWRSPALPIVAATVLATGAICAVVALTLPPGNSDSLVYHMPRVAYFLQFRSLDNYPTLNSRQVFYPVNAELLILWSVAFLRADRLANAVQLASWVATIVAVYGLGRATGLRASGALLGAGLFAMLPQSILQTKSAHNDLVVASFVAVTLFFLLQSARTPRPTTHLVLAGAAAGLAIGTKGTALLAVPGLFLVFLFVFGRRLERRLLPGLLIGSLAAILVGSYIYVQNGWVYGNPAGPVSGPLTRGTMTLTGFLANLGRTLWSGAFADLSGPLVSRWADPVAVPLVRTLASVGQRSFDLLAIPTTVPGLDVPYWPTFTFARERAVNDYSSGVGLIGGLILVAGVVTLVWPRRLPPTRRLLGLAALSYVVAMALLIPYHLFGAGRFLLTACALAAPLLGAVGQHPGRWWRTAALVLAIWSGATGLYVVWFNPYRVIAFGTNPARFAAPDWISRVLLTARGYEPYFREVEEELGPDAVLAVTGTRRPEGFADYLEYPFFGPRLGRTVVPLVDAEYATRLRRPPPWTNERLFETYRPAYLAMQGRESAAAALPDGVSGRCYLLPLASTRPPLDWQLWRCDDREPRSRTENGDFSVWTGGRGAFIAGRPGLATVTTADGWTATAADGARVLVRQLDLPAPTEEPFRLLLQYGAAPNGGEGAVFQEIPIDETLREMLLVVDVRLWADRPGSVMVRVNDGVTTTESENLSGEPETIRVRHAIDAQATRLRVSLVAGTTGQDAQVRVRSVLAIPRSPRDQVSAGTR